MPKNEEIRQKYPFFRKGLNDFEAEWITCACIFKVHKRKWKDYCDFVDIEYQKLISHSVTRWLSPYPSLPTSNDASNVPSFTFILHVHRQVNSCSETFFWKLSERTLFKTLRHLQSFVVAFNEQVQDIDKSKASLVEVVSCFATVKARIQ